jgi:1-acyl-sn-glycerol-3-phosphate acyltransferase
MKTDTWDSIVTRAVLKPNWIWRMLHPPVWLFCRLWFRIRADGVQHLDHTRGGLLLINHQSFLDPILAAVLLSRPVSYLARDSLFKVPCLGWLLRRTHVIPISRESVRGGSIRTGVERLEEGFLVGIFPEGTRSSLDSVNAFRPGFLALVRRTDQPIYPVAIAGANRAFPRGAWFIRPRRIQIVYGPPFSAEECEQLRQGTDDKALAEMARQKVVACHQQAMSLIGPRSIGQMTPAIEDAGQDSVSGVKP